MVETIKLSLKYSEMSNEGIKKMVLTGPEPLVVKVPHPACMGYLIWPQEVVIKQWIKQKRE